MTASSQPTDGREALRKEIIQVLEARACFEINTSEKAVDEIFRLIDFRAALSHQPGTGEADGSLQGMIRAVYGECDAEDCAFVDREWAKLRGYILTPDAGDSK